MGCMGEIWSKLFYFNYKYSSNIFFILIKNLKARGNEFGSYIIYLFLTLLCNLGA